MSQADIYYKRTRAERRLKYLEDIYSATYTRQMQHAKANHDKIMSELEAYRLGYPEQWDSHLALVEAELGLEKGTADLDNALVFSAMKERIFDILFQIELDTIRSVPRKQETLVEYRRAMRRNQRRQKVRSIFFDTTSGKLRCPKCTRVLYSERSCLVNLKCCMRCSKVCE